MNLPFVRKNLSELTNQQQNSAAQFEHTYDISFSEYRQFSVSDLKSLHAAQNNLDLYASVHLAESSDLSEYIETLRTLATPDPSEVSYRDRQRYFDALLGIYRSLPHQPVPFTKTGSHYVGIEREGSMIAQGLGWLPDGGSSRIHAKRINSGADLLVGTSGFDVSLNACSSAVIIDGAIASGSTMVAVIHALTIAGIDRVSVYSAHATEEGLRCVVRACATMGVETELNVGFVTLGLNHKFYAVEGNQLVVGDLGDMIAPIFGDSATLGSGQG